MNPFIGLIAGLSPSFFIILFAWKNSQKRDKALQHKLKRYSDKKAFPIRYASQSRFRKFWKFFPWESSGVLIIEDGCIKCDLSPQVAGSTSSLEFKIDNISINWFGNKSWVKNSLASWFIVKDKSDHKHYFTSETGTFIFGSHKSTKEILKEIKS